MMRGSVLGGLIAISALLGWGWSAAARAEVAGPPPSSEDYAAVAALARRFNVSADASAKMAAVLALSGTGSKLGGVRQSLVRTSQALEASNAGADLSAPPAPTGDALFDRYARAVDRRLYTFPSADSPHVERVAALDDAELAQWESEFGSDARYWELRYMCAKYSQPRSALAEGYAAPCAFLDEAVRRGCATANTLMLRYVELRAAHATELAAYDPPVLTQPMIANGVELGALAVTDWQALAEALPVSENLQAQAAAEIMARQEREQQELLNAAVSAGPDQAWPYYLRALYWFALGEQEAGLGDLQAGNAAPAHDLPAPWPLHLVEAGFGQPAPVGSAAVSGAIIELGYAFEPLDWSEASELLNNSLASCNLGGDLRPLEAWHQFACRLGLNNSLRNMYALAREVRLMSYMEQDLAAQLSPEQLETLQRFRGARTALLDVRRSNQYNFDLPDSIALIPFTGARGVAVGLYLYAYETWQAQNSGNPEALFSDLSQIHFPELALPECMRKYEAVTAEEAKRRRDERRAQEQHEGGGG